MHAVSISCEEIFIVVNIETKAQKRLNEPFWFFIGTFLAIPIPFLVS